MFFFSFLGGGDSNWAINLFVLFWYCFLTSVLQVGVRASGAVVYSACCCVTCLLLFLLSLCVDGVLVCAEGCTQVTGVMAMMMTGRVLLVCALCVLWCGAGGRCDEEGPALPAGGGVPPPGSKELGTLPQDTQELKVRAKDIKVKVPPESSPSLEEDEDEDRDEEEETTEDTEEEKEEKIKAPTKTHEGKKNEGASLPPPPPLPPLGGPTAERENPQNQKKVTNEATPSGPNMESEAPEPPSGDATQGRHSHDTDTEDSTKNAAAGSPAEPTTSSTSTSGGGDHVQNKADKDDAQSSEGQHDSLETGNTNVVPTVSETAPKTTKTTTASQTNVTTTPAENDSSTAVSHTTSPLLLLLVVACAAAAAVVAA
ncbi:Mucin-associated surface protein (MASP) subgroup S082 [Trypanosoma cruzi]|uniref:Mucin-associated surface protein (MASP) subgroup S082 n=1 Tax=Trypanosoma cruzi TaxID=5693 RepID=A0A7J6XK45_TRYCR|nr:Mucin-associated surface protein (MASP) subgroup S082 [Trypanosoma cruzi]